MTVCIYWVGIMDLVFVLGVGDYFLGNPTFIHSTFFVSLMSNFRSS